MIASKIAGFVTRIVLVVLVFGRMDLLAQRYKVSLEVQSESWVPGSRFDDQGFSGLCAASGITIMPTGSNGVDARALVQYRESKGPAFTDGLKQVGFGTEISYKLILRNSKNSMILFNIRAETGTPPSLVLAGMLHSDAVTSFKGMREYRQSCSLIAAALGSHSEAVKVLPWAAVRGPGSAESDVLKKGGFRPGNASERAYLAVSRRDFTAARAEGADSVEPLLFVFGRQARAERLTDADRQFLVGAVRLLASLGDRRAAGPLTGYLERNNLLHIRSTTLDPVFVAVIRALGQVGDASSLATLERLSKAELKGAAAKGMGHAYQQEEAKAAQELRKRLSQTPARH
jgi:hypothetical protein